MPIIVARRQRVQNTYQPVFEDWLFSCSAALRGVRNPLCIGRAQLGGPSDRVLVWRRNGGAVAALHRPFTTPGDAVTYHVFVNKPKHDQAEQPPLREGFIV